MDVLSLSHLSLYAGTRPLLRDLSFTIAPGEIFALVGESGSGKSLTALGIMRLLPPAITLGSGDIQLHGTSLFELREAQMQAVRGRKISMIFQEPMTALNPVMRVGEQVAEVIRLHLGLDAEAARHKVIALFDEVGIPDPDQRYGWYPHQLSGGQKQRIMIAIALACDPELLIADEPTTALDVTTQAQILALLRNLQRSRALAILFITHDMGVVYDIADRVAVLQAGRMVEQAPVADFFAAPQHEYTKKLMHDALPQPGFKTEPPSDALLEVRDLKVHFPIKKGLLKRTVGHVRAVDGVSFTIPKGETLALVGESGSGKSTIGQAILRLIDATEGTIRFDGDEITRLSERAMKPLRKKVQVIFQDPFSALNPRMTIGACIREGMQSLGVGAQDRTSLDARVDRLLEQVGLLPEHKTRYPHEFSGGQRQRIVIARALAVEPALIICDEPTSALDVSIRAQVLDLLESLQQRHGLSYLFITHDLSIISRIAHRVAVMEQGKIVETGPVEAVLHTPQHPYTRQLLGSAPKLVRERF